MEHGLRLPWWEFQPTDLALPGSVTPPDSKAEEGLLADFLQAAAHAETAECFISANSLNVARVLDALSRDELVLPAPPGWEKEGHGTAHRTVTNLEVPHLGCRSRLFGMPLADRHAALNVACSLRHRIPRRALVNFLCRLVLGKDVGSLPSPETDDEYQYLSMNERPVGARRQGRKGPCACGGRTLSAGGGTGTPPQSLGDPTGTHPNDSVTPGDPPVAVTLTAAPSTSTVCRSCQARRSWLDSFSARLLVVACRKLLWDRALPKDEWNALDRCLSALSEILGESAQSRSKSSRGPEAPRSDGAPTPTTSVAAVGVLAVRAGVRRRWSEALGQETTAALDHNQDYYRVGVEAAGTDVDHKKRPARGGAEGSGSLPGLSPPRSKQKVVRGARGDSQASARLEPDTPSVSSGLEGRARSSEGGIGGSLGPVSGAEQSKAVGTSASAAAAAAAILNSESVKAPSHSGDGLNRGGEKEKKEDDDCLSSAVRQRIASVAEKVAAAGARGATSTDVKNAAAAAVSLLQAAMKSPLTATSTHGEEAPSTPSSSSSEQQQRQPLEVVCSGIGLGVSRDKGAATAGVAGTAGCGDDLVLAVCDGFVTPSLSLKNCLAFVKAVLVPRARALTTPASRLLVTAVSGIGKARPGVVIDGLVVPLLCKGDPSMVGSAQCELCTRLIKQVLPKHNLEAVLVGLCGPTLDESAQTAGRWGGGGGGEGPHSGDSVNEKDHQQRREEEASRCVWTELTVPVITAALNLKPVLSDKAISALVRGVEAAAEQPKLQKSLKFTTLIHSLVTRYGPQLKAHVPMLRAAVGRCSTFMVKAVLAALQRLEK